MQQAACGQVEFDAPHIDDDASTGTGFDGIGKRIRGPFSEYPDNSDIKLSQQKSPRQAGENVSRFRV
jgi:hypothetical protein